jgi:hypothetical protein
LIPQKADAFFKKMYAWIDIRTGVTYVSSLSLLFCINGNLPFNFKGLLILNILI